MDYNKLTMKKILFFLLISTTAFSQTGPPYNGAGIIRGVQYTVNSANSRTEELSAGEIFTGTIVNVTTGEPNIQISVSADQPLEVQLLQYNDASGLEPLPVIHYDLPASIGLNQNINLTGNYFQVKVQNKGIASTTTFNLLTTTGFMSLGARNYIAPPQGTDEGMGVRPVPQINWRTTFAKVLASTWDTEFWARVSLGSGMANSQSAGNGVITSGTTANSETILRSRRSFNGSFLLRAQTTISQRIVNNNFVVELVDVIGDGLTLTAVSATSCIVTIPNNPFTSENVGQFINIGAIKVGTIPGTLVPGRYAIASVSGNNVSFTVSGWTGATSGTGTCSLFGWNYHQVLYTGTTATNASYDAQRKGWNSGATTATINTTASPGHMAIMGSDDGNSFLADQLVASATTLPISTRASRVVNIADETTDLWLQIRVLNGTTSPASTTTWTIGTISVENFASQQVTLASSKVQGANTTQPVSVLNTPAVTVSSGTVTTVSTLSNTTQLTPGTAATNLAKGEDNVAASGDVGVFTLGIRRDGPTFTSQGAAGDYSEYSVDDGGSIWTRDRPLTYSRLTADGQVKATAGHLQTLTFSPTGTVTAGVITIYDSATETGTVIFSCSLPATTFTPFSVTLNVAALTAIYVGYDATVANVQVTTSFR